MFLHMKYLFVYWFAASVAASLTNAQVSSAPDSATNSALNELVLELKIKSSLLLSLADEHVKKAGQSLRLNEAEKARWEQELVADLQTKNTLIAQQLSDLKAQQTKIDATNSGPGHAIKGDNLDADELIYLAKLNERFAVLDQELSGALQEAQNYALQLQTNNTPDQVQQVSLLLEDNKRLLRELRNEKSELTLKQYEFWAYRRRK